MQAFGHICSYNVRSSFQGYQHSRHVYSRLENRDNENGLVDSTVDSASLVKPGTSHDNNELGYPELSGEQGPAYFCLLCSLTLSCPLAIQLSS